jgi:hypothetical protein
MNDLLQEVAREQKVSYELLTAILAIEGDHLDLEANTSEALPRIEELLTRRVGR